MELEKFSRKYFELLTGEYSGINLTRINEFGDFHNKQIIDSLAPYKESTIYKECVDKSEYNIDIGFGGGFPILPLANHLPNKKFIGIETRNKKVQVVSEIANKLGLNNTSFLHSRIENVLIDIPAVCTLKAVGKVDDFLSKINSTQSITVFFYKGPGFMMQESDQLKRASKNWEIVENKVLDVPGTEKRLIIGFKNKNVPCGTTKITNQLVKLSSIL
jgi:16S rRNA (guanine527-N7)-methyltransferase